MVTYVLDSSAILRYLDGEAGCDRVAEILKDHVAGRCEAVICSLHWGEIAGQTCKRRGVKLKRNVPYVDAFGVELTADSGDRVFLTADFDFKAANRDVTIEFLPAK
jgi:predicted nucleic acid-binding protein